MKKKEITKLSFDDFARICIKRTNSPCKIKKGNIVKINERNKNIIGLIVDVYDNKMRLLNGASGYEWWSRYVNCKVIC